VPAHGKASFAVQQKSKRTAMRSARPREAMAHGKEEAHGKASGKRTATKIRTAKRTRRCRERSFAVRKAQSHGKGCFAVQIFLCRVPCGIFSFFFLYCIILMLIFILEI
jgi:hypothetical protein